MSRRPAARDALASLRNQSDAVRAAYLARLSEEQQSYLGYRRGAPATKRGQDVLLSLYYDFLRLQKDFENLSDDELREKAFPINDFKVFYENLRSFLIFYIETARPRSVHDQNITYKTASKARHIMIFWTNYFFNLRNAAPPRPNVLYYKLAEVLEGAAAKRKLTVATTSKAYIGIPELALLIDHDMTTTPCIELAECHQLAWCIGRFTAARPGSVGGQPKLNLADPDNDESFLMWRDISLSRAGETGTFIARVTFRNLKTNRFDPSAIEHRRSLTFTLLSPQNASNIQFSVPHRLLAIALRRNALVGIQTIDELFDGTLQNIRIKPEFLNSPVLVSGISRGTDVDQSRPLSSNAISAYLKLRAQRVGFPEGITFYSIRRRFATDLALVFGNDAAREIMGHHPKSSMLERYYLDFACMKNLVSTGLGEENDAQKDILTVESHPQFMNRLTPEQVAQRQGPALNELVREALANDAEFLSLEDPREIRLYQQRIRRVVFHTLWKNANEQAAEQMTIDTARARKSELFSAASRFSERMLKVIRDPSRLAQATLMVEESFDASETHGISMDNDFPESPLNDQFEPDADSMLMASGEAQSQGLTPQIDEDDMVRDDHTQEDAAYAEVAKAFMQTLLSSSLSTYTETSGEKVTCPLCRADPTVPDEKKARERTPNAQRSHLKDKYHSGIERFRRTVTLEAREGDGRFHCPYCREAMDDDDADVQLQSFHRVDYLFEHIRKSDSQKIHGTGAWKRETKAIEVHDEAKRKGGWYDEDWVGDVVELKRRGKVDQRRLLRMSGIRYKTEEELERGIPHESRPSLRRGGPSGPAIPPRYRTQLSLDPPASFQSIPSRLATQFSFQPAESFDPQPNHFRGMLVVKHHG